MPRYSPGPNAIDDWTGFKVKLSDLQRQWDGVMTVDPDRRNPQDFVRTRPDRMALPYARPEGADVFINDNYVVSNGVLVTSGGIQVVD